MSERKIVGYEIKPIFEAGRGITTQAFVLCRACGDPLKGTGGPNYSAFCLACLQTIAHVLPREAG